MLKDWGTGEDNILQEYWPEMQTPIGVPKYILIICVRCELSITWQPFPKLPNWMNIVTNKDKCISFWKFDCRTQDGSHTTESIQSLFSVFVHWGFQVSHLFKFHTGPWMVVSKLKLNISLSQLSREASKTRVKADRMFSKMKSSWPKQCCSQAEYPLLLMCSSCQHPNNFKHFCIGGLFESHIKVLYIRQTLIKNIQRCVSKFWLVLLSESFHTCSHLLLMHTNVSFRMGLSTLNSCGGMSCEDLYICQTKCAQKPTVSA